MNDGKGTKAKCPVCGKTFRRRKAKQIYCGKSCAAKSRGSWYKDRMPKPKPEPKKEQEPRVCRICGGSLEGLNKGAVYCGSECRNEARREQQRKPEQHEKICRCCGQKFTAKRKDVLYCSSECRQESWLRNCRAKDAKKAAEAELTLEQRGEPVLLRITRPVPVLPEMQPQVGKIYEGRILTGETGVKTLLIPGFGKYGLIVRSGEAKIVG